MSPAHPTRRTALAAIALPWLASCSASEPGQQQNGIEGRTLSANGSPREPVEALPAVAPYALLPGEVLPSCKQAAVDALTAALTWQQPTQGAAQASARLRAVGAAPGIASSMSPLVEDYVASTLQVTYPQYGGLSRDLRTASVMVVATQTFRETSRSALHRRQLIVDVRLERTASAWHATKVNLPGPENGALSTTIDPGRVLANRNLILPDPARADIAARIIDDRLLTMLDGLSKQWRLTVQVLKSGHPRNVFATDRVSIHTLGRGVDIWAIDGKPVIDQRASPWRAVMREAARLGANEIGGPADPDAVAGCKPFFTNNVHQDHIHLGFDDEHPCREHSSPS